MIKTRQIKIGIFTDKEMNERNEFIDHLNYELYVVQLPYLQQIEELDFKNNEYKQKLFALLKLFDQRAKKTDNEYRLRLFRRMFPGFLDRVIKRLQTADIDNPNLEKQMQAEDHYLKPLLQRDNKIAWFKLNQKRIEMELKEKDKALEVEKNKAKQLQLEFAKTLKENSVLIDVIHKKTGLPIDEIEKL
jgi:hypothetical protein